MLPDIQSAGSKAIRGVSVLLCLKVFQWYLTVLQEMESKAGENEEQYKHFKNQFSLKVEELHILH